MIDFKKVFAAAKESVDSGDNCIYPDESYFTEMSPEEDPPLTSKARSPESSDDLTRGQFPTPAQPSVAPKESPLKPSAAMPPATTTDADTAQIKILDHGAAKYEFKEDGTNSYFVKFEDDYGVEGVQWGVDLQRAIAESHAKIGDIVRLRKMGQQAVDIEVMELDKATGLKKKITKTVKRNSFEITPLAAEAIRNRAAKPAPAPAPIPTAVANTLPGPSPVTRGFASTAPSNDPVAFAPPSNCDKIDHHASAAANDQLAARFCPNKALVDYAMSLFNADRHGDEDDPLLYTSNTWLRKTSFVSLPPALLKTASNDALAAEGMVALATHKGWSPIHIEGTPEFKSNAFHQAVRMGIQVSDYTPTADDLKRLESANLTVPDWVPANEIRPSEPVHARKASSPSASM